MSNVVWGVVREGKIIPEIPLPEGASVQITLASSRTSGPPDIEKELESWQLGSAAALEYVEHLAENGTDETR